MVLQCTHHEACMYRYLHQGIRKKYCLPCVLEKFPDAEINSETYKKKFGPEVVTSKETTKIVNKAKANPLVDETIQVDDSKPIKKKKSKK